MDRALHIGQFDSGMWSDRQTCVSGWLESQDVKYSEVLNKDFATLRLCDFATLRLCTISISFFCRMSVCEAPGRSPGSDFRPGCATDALFVAPRKQQVRRRKRRNIQSLLSSRQKTPNNHPELCYSEQLQPGSTLFPHGHS